MTRRLAPGDVLAGRFRIEELIGEGGMGVVYRAVQEPLGRAVALKVLRTGSDDPKARARFEREARVASALSHPSAVAIHDFGETDGLIYLAMELIDGHPLRALLEGSGPLSLSRAVDVAWQTADVLAAAHRLPLVHRDLKPENVFLERRGKEERARVVDFGLAFIAETGPRGRMTVEGVVTGTPAYVSPEQARGATVGPATDVYALGCMLFEMLTGRLPFVGTEMEVLTRQMFAPPPGLRDVRPDLIVPTALGELVQAMLAKRADERPTADEVRSVLAQIDPERARSRERARDDTHLLGRAARMVTPPAADQARAEPPPPSLLLAIAGSVTGDLLLGLSANGIDGYVIGEGRPVQGAAAVFAPGATVEEVAGLCGSGLPVVADTDATDMARIAALLRAGAAEVVVRPVSAETLVRRLHRVLRSRGRVR